MKRTKTYLAKQDIYRKGSPWDMEYRYIAKKCSKLV